MREAQSNVVDVMVGKRRYNVDVSEILRPDITQIIPETIEHCSSAAEAGILLEEADQEAAFRKNEVKRIEAVCLLDIRDKIHDSQRIAEASGDKYKAPNESVIDAMVITDARLQTALREQEKANLTAGKLKRVYEQYCARKDIIINLGYLVTASEGAGTLKTQMAEAIKAKLGGKAKKKL